MRKAMGAVLLAGLFLLLLSALVVTPEAPADSVPPALPENMHAVFAPALLPPVQQMAQAKLKTTDEGEPLLCALALAACALPCCAPADADGRIVTAVRYENSVYQVFRPEVAGG